MAAASSSSSSYPLSTSTTKHTPSDDMNPATLELLREVRSHEVAIAELNSISESRAVYQKNGNIFFRRNVKSAIAAEQKQLDQAKAQLEKLNATK